MKVLFVASANKGTISPIVINQGSSLAKFGITINYFGIEGKGITGYLSSVSRIRKQIRNSRPDLIHAHYSYSGFAARLAAGGKPVVVSLMGSDLMKKGAFRLAIRFFSRYLWDKTIVKSEWMANRSGCPHAVVIPNGVDLDQFHPMSDRAVLKRKFDLQTDKKHILFIADPARYSKNYALARQAAALVPGDDTELVARYDMPHSEIPELINAADVVLLTSRWEGSPNIVKEAMACNCPVVGTDVGDISWLFNDQMGYYIADPDPADIAQKLGQALQMRKGVALVNGRRRLEALGLDSGSIAKRISAEYHALLSDNRDHEKEPSKPSVILKK